MIILAARHCVKKRKGLWYKLNTDQINLDFEPYIVISKIIILFRSLRLLRRIFMKPDPA